MTATSSPTAGAIAGEILVSIPAFDDALALRTYAHLSHTPDIRARQERDGYEAHILAVVTNSLEHVGTRAQLEELHAAVTEYAIGYQSRLYQVLGARSRTASAFITGGANFPSRRNQKALATESKREEELRKYVRIGTQRVVDRIKALDTPALKSAVIVARMCKGLDGDLAMIAAIERGEMPGYEVKSFTASITRIVGGLHRKGFLSETNAVLDHIERRREELCINALAKSAIWGWRTDSSEVT